MNKECDHRVSSLALAKSLTTMPYTNSLTNSHISSPKSRDDIASNNSISYSFSASRIQNQTFIPYTFGSWIYNPNEKYLNINFTLELNK